MKASSEGHTEIVRILLGHPGIDVNLKNKVRNKFLVCNDTPIDHSDFLQMYFFTICKVGRTAFTMASDKGRFEIADLLSTHLSINDATVDDQADCSVCIKK